MPALLPGGSECHGAKSQVAIVKYLAEDGTVKDKEGRLTLRMLLTHTGMSSPPRYLVKHFLKASVDIARRTSLLRIYLHQPKVEWFGTQLKASSLTSPSKVLESTTRQSPRVRIRIWGNAPRRFWLNCHVY